MGIIYQFKNKIDGKIYVGKTKSTLKTRVNQHRFMVRHGSSSYFHNALRKYGEDNFEITILFNGSDDTLSEMEIYYISQTRSNQIDIGYNLTGGGEGGDTFRLLESKAQTQKRLKHQNQTPRGISSKMCKGQHVTEYLTSEQTAVWYENFSKAMANVSERRRRGIKTEAELNGLAKQREQWSSQEERKARSDRSTGSLNSQYKGPYIVNGIEYKFIKDVKQAFHVYGSISNIRKMLIKQNHIITF